MSSCGTHKSSPSFAFAPAMATNSPTISSYRCCLSMGSSSQFPIPLVLYSIDFHNKHLLFTMKQHDVLEALRSFVLMDPTRSITNRGGSMLLGGGQVATPSLEQIRRDINEIGWEECSIGSIQTIQPAQLAVKAEMKVNVKEEE